METNIIDKSMGIIIFAVMVVVIFGIIFINTNFEVITDTDTFSQTVPFNLTLTGNNPQTLINFSNGSVTIPATNYTDNLINGIFTVLDNSSFGGTPTLTYNDQHTSFIGGASATLVLLTTIFFVIAFFGFALSKKAGK